MKKRQSCVIAAVEDFIKLLHDGDLVIESEARDFVFSSPKKGPLGLPSKEIKRFGDKLGWAIATYQLHKDHTPNSLTEIAYHCLDIIERARVWGFIKPLKLTNQFKECQEQNQRLRDNQLKLEKEILRLQIENEELHKALGRFGATSEVGQE